MKAPRLVISIYIVALVQLLTAWLGFSVSRDYLIEPPMPDIGLRDWHLFDRAIAEGYEHAQEMIQKHGVPLTHVWNETALHNREAVA